MGHIQNQNCPPQAMEAERSLLGGIILKPARIDDVIDVITAEDFYNKNHRAIYQAILKLEASSQTVDVVSVADALGDNALERVGGLLFIGGLAESTPGSANIEAYSRIIRDKAIERNLLEASHNIQSIVGGEGTTREKADQCEAAILSAVEERGEAGAVLLSDVSASVIDRLEARMNNEGSVTGLPTGFERLDSRLSGLQKGNLIIIAGRPSMGKTTLALNIAENATLNGAATVVVFSSEMGKEELADKTTCNLASVDNQKFKNGTTNDDDLARMVSAIGRQSKMKLLIDDTGDITALQIKSRARKIKHKHGLDLIVIDYLQLMNIPKDRGENLSSAIGRVTRQLKITAKELDVPIILLSQLNRSLESRANKRPIMSDLRESGSIEQDADVILFIYRDEQYEEESPDQDLAEIITAKFRNGQTGFDVLEFEGRYNRFSNTLRNAQSRQQKKQRKYAGGFD